MAPSLCEQKLKKILVPLSVPTSGTHGIGKIHTYVKKWASLVVQLVKNPPAMQETLVRSLGWEESLEKGKATHSSVLGLPGGSDSKESACNAGDLGSIPGLGRSPGEGNGYTLRYSGLDSPMDYTVCGILHAKILEWIAVPFFRRSFQPRDQTQVSHIAGRFSTV